MIAVQRHNTRFVTYSPGRAQDVYAIATDLELWSRGSKARYRNKAATRLRGNAASYAQLVATSTLNLIEV